MENPLTLEDPAQFSTSESVDLWCQGFSIVFLPEYQYFQYLICLLQEELEFHLH